MKKFILYSLFFLRVCTVCLGQEEKRGLTKPEYDAVKMLTVKNLEKDTYIKLPNGFILDRYESRPAYVFKFSDGIERRIYLYKVFETDQMKEIGMLAFFVTPKDGKQLKLCIPNAMASKEIWGAYIDDLKDNDKKIAGFSSCVAFVLSREFSGGGKNETTSESGEYEYCFPADAHIQLADGTEKNIADIQPGDQLTSFQSDTKTLSVATVTQLQVHDNQSFSLSKLLLSPANNTVASQTEHVAFISLEATPNHPVWTQTGKKELGAIQTGEIVYLSDHQTHTLQPYRVHAVFQENRKVTKVYNLVTNQATYVVNGIVVFGK